MSTDGKLLLWAVGASVVVHAAVGAALPNAQRAVPPVSTAVEFVALAPRAPEPKPELAPEPEPEPAPQPEPARPLVPTRAETATVAPPQAAPAPSVQPAAPLSGQTLTSDGEGADFAAPAGDGSERMAPIQGGATSRRPPPPQPRPAPPAARPKPPPPPPTVPLGKLSRRPEPPALAGSLARNYPASLRQRGAGGQATVRARVDADGRVRSAVIASESEPGFGAACQRTLLGSVWTPPLNGEGQRVGTWVRYVCRFRVGL